LSAENNTHPRSVWSRTLAGLIAATSVIGLLPAVIDGGVPVWERVFVTALVAAAALTPRPAALVLVAGIPLAFLGPPVSGSPFRLTEALVVAAIAGWSTRACVRGGAARLPRAFLTAAVLTGVVLLCSVLVVTASSTNASPAALHDAVGLTIRHDYFVDTGVLGPAEMGFMQVQALALFVACAGMAVATPAFVESFARMLVAGAGAAGLLNLQRFAQIALRSESPFAAMRFTLRNVRINVSYGDVNAAGSFFALGAVVAARLAVTRARAAAVIGAAATAIILAALWLTQSRAAVAAFLVACVGMLLVAPPSKRRRAVVGAGLAACVIVAAVFVVLFPNRIAGAGTSLGWLTRSEMAKVSLRMTRDHLWFGVGVGRFYNASAQYLLSTKLGTIYPHENAHNNYLQMLAELGIVGAAAVLWLLLLSCRHMLDHVRTGSTARLALAGGLLAFAATMLFGHPLLTREVCYTFALAAGTATGAGMRRDTAAVSGWMRIASVAAAVALLASVPWRVHGDRASANLEQVAWGTSRWHIATDGVLARVVLGKTTLFIPTRAKLVEIPYRLDRPGPTVTFSVVYRDHAADDLVVSGTSWGRYRLIAGGRTPESSYEPVVLLPKSGDPANVLLGQIVEY
jgi:O-antigen ligase